MAKKSVRRTSQSLKRPMTDKERARWKKQLAEINAIRPELESVGREFKKKPRHYGGVHSMSADDNLLIVCALHQERLKQGLSLADMQERTEIDRSTISNLESGKNENPTIGTLNRIAQALGKRIEFKLIDAK